MTTEVETQAVLDARWLPVKDVIESPLNPRHVRDEAKLAELTASVRDVGVLQPVVVRPHPKKKDKWELLAGSRRLEACRRADRAEIPAMVRELDDEAAFRVTVLENLQREDLTPFEESEAIRAMQGRGWEIETIAAQLGKSPGWVARRAALGNLTPAWQAAVLAQKPPAPAPLTLAEKRAKVEEFLSEDEDAPEPEDDAAGYSDKQIEALYEECFGDDAAAGLDDGDEVRDFSEWPVGHLELVARMPVEVQNELMEHFWNVPTLSDLHRQIDRFLRNLSAAPWKHEVALAGRVPCVECALRSDRQPHLFEDMAAAGKPAMCLGPACWAEKLEAWLKAEAEAMLAKHGPDGVVFVKDRSNDRVPAGGRSALYYELDRCKKKDKGAVAALAVGGHNVGERFWVRPLGSRGRGAGSAKTGPKSLKERKEALEARRGKFVIERVLAMLNADGPMDTCPTESSEELAALAAIFGTHDKLTSPSSDDYVHGHRKEGSAWDRFGRLMEASDERRICAALWAQIKPVLEARLKFYNTSGTTELMPEVQKLCAYMKFDYAAIRAEAEAALLEPRAWAGLNADGTPKAAGAPPEAKKTKVSTTKGAQSTKAGEKGSKARKGKKEAT